MELAGSAHGNTPKFENWSIPEPCRWNCLTGAIWPRLNVRNTFPANDWLSASIPPCVQSVRAKATNCLNKPKSAFARLPKPVRDQRTPIMARIVLPAESNAKRANINCSNTSNGPVRILVWILVWILNATKRPSSKKALWTASTSCAPSAKAPKQ